MNTAALYRWRIKPGREAEFAAAWDEGTKRIHQACGSYGAILHRGDDGLFWSYASWPDEEARQRCFAENDWFSMDCFKTMQDCIAERFPETVMQVERDQLAARKPKPAMPVLHTARLHLRPLEMSDAEALTPALMDDDTMRYWTRPAFNALDEVRDYISWNVHTPEADCFAVCRSEEPSLALGWVILMPRSPGIAEIGYILVPDARGQGLAREALDALLDHARKTKDLRRIYADIDPDNTASKRLLEGAGFVQEAHLRATWETHLGVRDSLIYALVD